jgi:hypothetical protein
VREHFPNEEVFVFTDERVFSASNTETELSQNETMLKAYSEILSEEELGNLCGGFALVVVRNRAHLEKLKKALQFNFGEHSYKNDHAWWLYSLGDMVDMRSNYPSTWRERH